MNQRNPKHLQQTSIAPFAIGLSVLLGVATQGRAATAVAETVPYNRTGDIADDSCVWVHPTTPSKSILIGMSKATDGFNGGLYTFKPDGTRSNGSASWQLGTNWFERDERYNNIDLRYQFPAGNEGWDIVCAANRGDNEIEVFRVVQAGNGDFLRLDKVGEIPIGNGFNLGNSGEDAPYGLGMYQSNSLGKYFVFASDKNGNFAQYELSYNANGAADRKIVGTRRGFWTINAGSEIEGIVADDDRDIIYIASEDVAIYRYQTNSNGVLVTSGRVTVDTVNSSALTADIEGLAIYKARGGRGYLIASSQGNDTYAVYNREFSGNSPNPYIFNFSIGGGNGIDGVQNTDGIEVVSVSLGGQFTSGMFIAHDGSGNPTSNYKLVRWSDIANDGGQNLLVDTGFDPAGAVLESKKISVSQPNAGAWTRVNFGASIVAPAVVAGPGTQNDSAPYTIRVRNVTPYGFELKLDEWDYLDGSHGTETVSYLAIASGRNRIGGRIWEAGVEPAVNQNWKTVSMANNFGGGQTVLTQCTSYNGSSAVVTRVRNVNGAADTFQVRLQEEEGNDGFHANESVAWVAVASDVINSAELKYEAGNTGNNVTAGWWTESLGQTYNDPILLVGAVSFDGADPCYLNYRNLGSNSFQVRVREEQSFDSETGHTTELLRYLVIDN